MATNGLNRTKAKRIALATALVAVTGCSSTTGGLASLNPFSRSSDTPATAAPSPNPVSGFAAGARNQASSLGMTAKSAFTKTRDGVAGLFGGDKEVVSAETGEQIPENDPLRLDNKPNSINSEVLVANGQLWEASGNYERALDNYSKALEKEPENGPALASVARLHYRQEHYDQAIPFFERAIKATPSDAGLYNDLGLTFSRMGRHQEAASMIERAMAIEPTKSRYANNMATVHFHAGNAEAARAVLLKHNSPAVAHYNMAYLHYSANQNDKAMQELGQVLAQGGSVGNDPAGQTAITKAKELYSRLSGPATQIAQALPAAVNTAQQAGQAATQLSNNVGNVVAQVTGNTTTPVRAQLTDTPAAPTGNVVASGPPTTAVAPTAVAPPVATAPVATAPVATAPAGNSFAVPPEFSLPPAVAGQPSSDSVKR